MNGLASIVEEEKLLNALVVGDLILDRYVEGSVERINPEAPVPVVRASEERFLPGGAANVARNLVVLGAGATLLGVVGEDADGELLRDLCEREGVACSGMLSDPGRPTTKKSRVISGGHHIVRVDWEKTTPVPPRLENRFIDLFRERCASCQVVVVSDYGKGMLTPRMLREMIAEAGSRGVALLVDPKGREFGRYSGAFALTPNKKEAEEWSGRKLDGDSAVDETLAALKKDLSLRGAVITLGAGGMAWIDENDSIGRVKAEAREVFDVTGAGDTVIATLACFIGSGAGLAESLRIANVAAGISVGRVGAVAVSRGEILERIFDVSGRPEKKILARGDVGAWVSARRMQGKRIVFTNGCFDILHRGHAEYLQFCRRAGDALLVGLNSDRSVRSIKGPDRPVNSQADRAYMLACLESVDGVVVFDEDIPEAIIRQADPDVLVKGEDWKEKGVVGREWVESRGGKVILAPLKAGYSTSKTIDDLKAANTDLKS